MTPFSMRVGMNVSLLALASLLTTSACSVQLITDYDPVIDGRIEDIAEKTEAFVEKVVALSGSEAGKYEAHAAFYQETKASLRVLKMRADATPKAELVAQQLTELQANFENLRKLHELGAAEGLRPAVAETAAELLRVQFRAIHKLQTELRQRGSK